jgi:hypothetical protein
MGHRVVESMTKMMAAGYVVRIWRDETGNGSPKDWRNEDLIDMAIELDELKPPATMELVAAKYAAMLRVNAVEILDTSGCGILVYPDWP